MARWDDSSSIGREAVVEAFGHGHGHVYVYGPEFEDAA
jgi:hypothetical protein